MYGSTLDTAILWSLESKIFTYINLIHLSLPMSCNKKFKFSLCHRSVSENKVEEECTCTHEERESPYIYYTPETNLARNSGYEMIHVFEVFNCMKQKCVTLILSNVIYSLAALIHS